MPPTSRTNSWYTTFESDLGWMAMAGSAGALGRLVFGYESAGSAERAFAVDRPERSQPPAWAPALQHRLQDYAAGRPVEFNDVPAVIDGLSPFALQVFAALRDVAYGQVVTYGALADRAGSPRASRAVGNLMAANPMPLVIPCHRVVCSDGRIGRFSAPGGTAMKRRLLEMERLAGGRHLTPFGQGVSVDGRGRDRTWPWLPVARRPQGTPLPSR